MITLSLQSSNGVSNQVLGKIKNASMFEDGAVYTAVITNISSSTVQLKLQNGFELKAKASSITNSLGDSVTLQASRQSDGSYALKIMEDLGNNATFPSMGSLNANQTLDLFKQADFISEENVYKITSVWEGSEFGEETRLAISKLQSKITHALNNLSLSAVNELLSSGISIQNLNITMLNSVLREVRESPEALTEQALDDMIDGYMAAYNIDEKGLEQKADIIALLGQNQLPITQENIEFIEKCAYLYESAKDLSKGAIAKLIGNGADITFGDLYKANYSALSSLDSSVETAELTEEIIRFFAAEGIDNNEENMSNAQFLLEYELSVTVENIEKVSMLKNLSNSTDLKSIMKMAIQGIKQNQKAEDTVILLLVDKAQLVKTYEELIQDVPNITDSDIAYLSAQNIPITLYNLRNYPFADNYPQAAVLNSSHKLMVAEIQLKLTTDAANRLISKGINIDTMPVAKAVEALRATRREAFEQALETAGGEITKQNVSKMEEIFTVIQSFQPLTNNVFSDIMTEAEPFTIAGIASSRHSARIMGELEKFMTVPTGKYGDSFQKIKDQFAPLLESMGIEATPENINASSILTKSGVEVTPETILQVKIIHLKINKIQDTLHPSIAADMIKEGINPLDSHVDEMLDYIDSYNDEYGQGIHGRLAEHIYSLDKSGKLSKDERAAMVAVYRLLSEIERNGSAAIGAALKANHTPTLGNLLNSSHYLKGIREQTSFTNITISEKESYSTASAQSEIRDTLQSAAQKNASASAAEHASLVLKNLAGNLTPDNLLTLINSNNLWDTPIDEIAELINTNTKYNTSQTLLEQNSIEIYEQIKDILAQGPEIISQVESLGLNATFANIKAFKDVSKPKYIASTIKELAEQSKKENIFNLIPNESLTSLSEEEGAEKILEEISAELESAAFETGDAGLLREVRLLQCAVKVQNALCRRQNQYKLPVSINGEICELTMFMPHGYIPNKNTLDVAISLSLDESQLNALCQVSGNSVTIALNSEGFGLTSLQGNEHLLNNLLKESGFFNNNIIFNSQKPFKEASAKISNGLQKPDKNQIFTLAKVVTAFTNQLLSTVIV